MQWSAGVLTATGVGIPLVEAAGPTNFVGYVARCVWLLAVAVMLFRVLTDARARVLSSR